MARLGWILMLAWAAAGVGCQTDPEAVQWDTPTLNLTTSRSEVAVGETTTVFAQTTNMLGREIRIDWDATLGEIEPIRDGRMARFRSDEPGEAVVTATMSVDDEVYGDALVIEVRDEG